MQLAIVVEGADALGTYASVPIAYRTVEVLDVDSPLDSNGLLPFGSRMLDAPIAKDYDALPGNHPLDWSSRFDLRSWGFVAAYIAGRRVGGAVIVPPGSGIDMLEGRAALALLWDIRVAPEVRNHGVGTALLAAGGSWAQARGARVLKVETQNTNLPACRFYAHCGFVLRAVRRGAYPELPNEVQLLWYKDLVDL